MPSENIYHRPLKPTTVTLQEGSSSPREVTVGEDDLISSFRDRVRFERRWNSDNNVIASHAYFDSPLTSAEIGMIEWMSDEYQHRLEMHRPPLRPPTLSVK
jgi:phosphoglycerate-specific signal transduction histidine kinase